MKAIISRRDADIFRQAIRGVAYKTLAQENSVTPGRINQIVAYVRVSLAALHFNRLGFRPKASNIKDLRLESAFWLNALNEESALGNLIVHTPMNQDNEINVRHQALLLVEL